MFNLNLLHYPQHDIHVYSRTSNEGLSEKGITSLQGTLPISLKLYNLCNTFQLPKRGQPPYKGENVWSQCVLYSEVPLSYY